MANGLKKTKLLTQYLELFKHPQIQISRHIHDDYSHSRQDSDGNGKKLSQKVQISASFREGFRAKP